MSTNDNPLKPQRTLNLWNQLRRRGVLRVAISYAVISWLLLQIGDVVLDPLDAPDWVMRALIILVFSGFPIALILAWFFELGPGGITLDQLPESANRPTVSGVRRFSDILVIAMLLAVIVVLLLRQEGLLEPEHPPPVIGVLPFLDLGGSSQEQYGDGMAATLIHQLGQLQGLVVLAPSSTFQFRGSGLDIASVAQKLGADSILEGSLQRAGGVLRISTRLINAKTGQQQWSATYNRRNEDVFAVQDDIAQAVTSALEVVLAPQESRRLVHHDTLNLTAFDAYNRARTELAKRSPEGMAAALQHLYDAIQTDPDYALAYAALPEAYYLAATYRWDTSWADVSAQAKEAADKALSLNPELGEAYLAQAYVLRGERSDEQNATGTPRRGDSEIIAMLEKALALSPNNAVAWKLYAEQSTDSDEFLARMEKAARLDPRSPVLLLNLGSEYEKRGDLAKARAWYQLSLTATEPYFSLAMVVLMESYLQQADQMAMTARLGRGFWLAFGEGEDEIWREYNRALIELGAWDQVAQMLLQAEQKPGVRPIPIQLHALGAGARLYRSKGELARAAEYAAEFQSLYLPVVRSSGGKFQVAGPPAAILDILPLHDLSEGRANEALEWYDRQYPDMAGLLPTQHETDGLNARMLKAAAQKQLGDGAQAEQDLRLYLQQIADLPIKEQGFVAFSLHAFLGETELAIKAFEKAVDAGFNKGWWGLRNAAFDADYAAVLDDPRFQKIYSRLESRVTQQREAFLADPELPIEMQLQAGLIPRN